MLKLSKDSFGSSVGRDAEDVEAEIGTKWPEMHGLSVRRWSIYLGFAIGPERGARSWDKACAKVVDRVRCWNWKDLGLQFSAVAYNTYVASVLSFVAQLEVP